MIAKTTKCGILPVGITGTQEVKRIPCTGKIVVRIGKVIPYSDGGEVNRIRKYGQLISEEYSEDGILVKAYVPKFMA